MASNTEFDPFGSFTQNIKNYIDQQVSNSESSQVSESQVKTWVEEYINANDVTVSSSQIQSAVDSYMENNPVTVSDSQVQSAVDSYMEENPVETPDVSDSQVKSAVDSYMQEYPDSIEANPVFETIDKLRTYEPSNNNETATILSHTYEGYGGGLFKSDVDDSDSEDDNAMVVVTEGGKRWKRVVPDADKSNVLYWGADPSGETDCSDILQKMVDKGCRTLYFPNEKFMIDKTVTLDNGNLIGNTWSYWGQNTDSVALIAGPNLKHDDSKDDTSVSSTSVNDDGKVGFSNTGWMFDNVRLAVGLSFKGTGAKSGGACGIRTNSYVHRIFFCAFHDFNAALGQLNCDSRIENNTFTSTIYAGVSIGGTITTVTFRNNEMQYVNTGLVFTGGLWGSNISENVYESCGPGPFVIADVIFQCNFMGNWIEGGGGYEKDDNGEETETPVKIIQNRNYQQSRSNFAAANKYNGGTWTDWFNSEIATDDNNKDLHNDKMGGVSVNDGDLTVSGSTGRRVIYNEHGIKLAVDDWSGKDPLTIKTDWTKYGDVDLSLEPYGSLNLRPPHSGHHVVLKNEDSANWGNFNSELRFQKGVVTKTDDNDEEVVDNRHYERLFMFEDGNGNPMGGMDGRSETTSNNTAVTGVPIQVVCRDDKFQVGQEAFTSINRDTEGQVTFKAPHSFDNPSVMVTVEDQGVIHSGITWDNGDGNKDNSTRWSDTLTVHFTELSSGNAVTPKCFHIWINCHKRM